MVKITKALKRYFVITRDVLGVQVANRNPSHKPEKSAQNANKMRQKASTEGGPSRTTVKKLFAFSGNKCAFQGCRNPIVDSETHSILGEICHIKGTKIGSARHDSDLPSKEVHSFDNLILMCGTHHKLIDDNPKRFTVERLRKLKSKHESEKSDSPRLSNSQIDKLTATSQGNKVRDGSVFTIKTQNQSQAAHTIHNTIVNHSPIQKEAKVKVAGRMTVGADPLCVNKLGSLGIELTVTCRSSLKAKIRSAEICVEGRGFVKAFEEGFGRDFGHNPPEGKDLEIYWVKFNEVSKRDPSSEGFTLTRGDVCRFFVSVHAPVFTPFLTAKPEQIYIRITFFDKTKKKLLRGEVIHDAIRQLVGKNAAAGIKPPEAKVGLEIKSLTPPEAMFGGFTNPNSVNFASREALENIIPPSQSKIGIKFAIGILEPTNEATFGLQVTNESVKPLPNVSVVFRARVGPEKVESISFHGNGSESISSRETVTFSLPFASAGWLKRIVASISPDLYGMVVRANEEVLGSVLGLQVYLVILQTRKAANGKQTEVQGST